jgi:hypothetical protein
VSRALSLLLIPAAVVIFAFASRRLPPSKRTFDLGLDGRWTPLLVGVLTALFSTWMWSSLDAPSSIHDETAYLLQAEIFASGSWSAPPPPLPEFFQQFHVLVTPRLAPKYWPGHGLLLVPGVLLGLTALMPILLSGLAGGLIFTLGRRVAGPEAAAIGWSLWLTGAQLAVWRTTYLPVTSSTALWLGGAYFLERWWRRGSVSDLVGLAVVAAWLAITRPLTAVAFALPALYPVFVLVRREKLWRQLLPAVAAGTVVLAILPLWSHSSTGSWLRTPYLAYQLIPLEAEDSASLVPEADAATRPFVPPDAWALRARYQPLREQFTLEVVPRLLVSRIQKSFSDLFDGPDWRFGLVPFFLIGVIAFGRQGRFALSWPLALVLIHLWRPHFTYWSVYYVETLGIIAVATGAGVCWVWLKLARRKERPLASIGSVVLALFLVAGSFKSCLRAKQRIGSTRSNYTEFRTLLERLPTEARAIVFVRYSEFHDPDRALVRNPPDYDAARHWVVYDRGEENWRLLDLAPERVPYLFDEETFELMPIRPVPAEDAEPSSTSRSPASIADPALVRGGHAGPR